MDTNKITIIGLMLVLIISIIAFVGAFGLNKPAIIIQKSDIFDVLPDTFPDFVHPYNHCLMIYTFKACENTKGCNFEKAETICSPLLKQKKK